MVQSRSVASRRKASGRICFANIPQNILSWLLNCKEELRAACQPIGKAICLSTRQTLRRQLLGTCFRYYICDANVLRSKLSENVLNAIADHLPELVGGSADLTHSNLTRWKTAVDFQMPSKERGGNYAGRYIRFGVREHGMAAICNGMAAYGVRHY